MTQRRLFWGLLLGLALTACSRENDRPVFEDHRPATDSTIALANLDHLIEQGAEESGVEDLLLLRSKMVADYAALDRAVRLAESSSDSADALLRRARSRAAVHRFAQALTDLDAAASAGANAAKVAMQRASILIAMGRAKDVLGQLESNALRRPGFASHSALAAAYAALGRLAEAEQLYAVALEELDTTSPFPYASIYFMRGLMWAEQGHDAQRGESMYAQAVRYVPEFVAANIHLAELEVARRDLTPAIERLERIVAASNEPEALALLGRLHIRVGQSERGRQEIALAAQRYETLLAKHRLAFADHAAEFYLRDGDNAECAWVLAQQNLSARQTRRAYTLAIQAARATNRRSDADALDAAMQARLGPRAA
jgi:tetratricopeptide (TPR) repeat protein